MKVAIIGAGSMGEFHSSMYQQFPDLHVAAVVDINLDRAAQLAEIHGGKGYASMEEMFDHEQPDMVDICTPTYMHEEMAVRAMERKIHVLCEKPISLHYETARNMVDTSVKHDTYLMIAQVIRFWPEYVYLKKVYEEQSFGRLKHVLFSRISPRPQLSSGSWMMSLEKSGRAPLDLHIHDTDFIMFLLGKPIAVKSSGLEDGDTISYISTQYVYEGMVVEAEGGWYNAPIPFNMTFRAVFERALLEFDFLAGKLIVYPVEGESYEVDLEQEKVTDEGNYVGYSIGCYNQIKYFTNCIRNKIPLQIITPQQSLDCLSVVLREIESARTGGIMNV